MNTLHIAPGDSAGGSLIQAIRDAGQDDKVLPFHDDLSCGPIDPDEPSTRAAWWNQFYDASKVSAHLGEFWGRVHATDDRLVVWFGRHSASELAFFLAWTDRLGERPYQIIDVTGRRLPFRRRDGSTALSQPVRSVSIVPPDGLKSLLGTERPITSEERDVSRQCWRRLQTENTPFRIVTEIGLISTSIDHFDPLLLAQATSDWQSVGRIVGNTMGYNSEPYIQVADLMLQARVVALVDEGRLLADGDPWSMSCRVRLRPGGYPAD
ncbi:MAG TPA: DUF3658 domain-containing protein [Stellaceae bacterium]|nr:DUF3658 domain-containing protein [Stellaceae bacterium]